MAVWLLAFVVSLGLAALALMAFAQRRHLAGPSPGPPGTRGGVSILKPLKGVDAGLEGNLASFFTLDYPEYEVLLGVRDADDPAVDVARRVAAAHPRVPSRVVVDGREVGLNPKVNNLANLARHARHDLLLISDSNVRVDPGYLEDLVSHLGEEGVGLVSSPIRAGRGATVGGEIESFQLNTFVMGGVAALHELFGGVCVVGKSMLISKSVLDRLGGFRFLGRYLAEDQVCGEAVARLGLRVALSSRPIENTLGLLDVRGFLARHLRWARIRRRMSPAGYAGELLLQPVFLAAIGLAIMRDVRSAALLGAAVAASSLIGLVSERAAGVRRHPLAYPLLVLARDLLVGCCWAVPFFTRRVAWRGNRFVLGPRTLLIPEAGNEATAPSVPDDVTGGAALAGTG
ncbi:MAG: ceramide glucosyltransferase [Acidobacteriota bacterium]